MEKQPLISIVIPVYNTERFLEKCLKSVLSQTYPNIEIIVVNNESTDSSRLIIEKYLSDKKLKCYDIKHVNTVCESRNNAYIRATAEWVIPVDSDDYISNDFVERLWKRHLETNADIVGACMTQLNIETGELLFTCPNASFDWNMIVEGKDAVKRTLPRWEISANGALIRRKLIPCVRHNNTKPDFTDEFDFRVMLYDAQKVAFENVPYYYSYNPNSTGKKVSFARLMYSPMTNLGLLIFMKEKYGEASREFHFAIEKANSNLVHCLKKYMEARKVLSKSEKREYYNLIRRLEGEFIYGVRFDSVLKNRLVWLIVKFNMLSLSLLS